MKGSCTAILGGGQQDLGGPFACSHKKNQVLKRTGTVQSTCAPVRLRRASGSYGRGLSEKERKTKRADEQHNINTWRVTSGSGLGDGPHGEHGSAESCTICTPGRHGRGK